MSTTLRPNRIRSMNDLKLEKYRLKANLTVSEANAKRNWEKFTAAFTFSNLSVLLGEQLFPGSFSDVRSKFTKFSGIWNSIASGLMQRLFERFASKKD